MTDSLEDKLRQIRDALRERFTTYAFTSQTEDAVTDRDLDRDGRLDPNPDTSGGDEPGFFSITAHREGKKKVILREGGDNFETIPRLTEVAVKNLLNPDGWA